MVQKILSLVLLAAGAVGTAHAADAKVEDDPLVGTWVIKVPGPTPQDTFYALHTFHAGGTFTEVSSLLPLLGESPARGSWERNGNQYKNGNDYKLTFILFRFDNGVFAGYIQVRCRLKLTGDRIDATTIVDLIEPDGTVIPSIATGPFFGFRQKIDPSGLKIDVPAPDAAAKAAYEPSLPGDPRAARAWRRLGR